MEIKIKSYSSQSSLISSILFFIAGGILFWYSDVVISTLSMLVGIILAATGVIEFVAYGINRKKGINKPADIIRGIILIGIAIVFIFAKEVVNQAVRFVVGAWILFSGINRLIETLAMSKRSRKFLPILIVSLLLIIIGIYTILIGDVILSTIGILMMIYSAIDIAGYIFYRKDEVAKEEEGTTTLIVPEEEKEHHLFKKKNKKVKDAKESKKDDK